MVVKEVGFSFIGTRKVYGVGGDWAKRNELLGSSNEIIEVPVVDFYECLKKYGIPHYLKIDIEGMDTMCLKASKVFFRKSSKEGSVDDFAKANTRVV